MHLRPALLLAMAAALSIAAPSSADPSGKDAVTVTLSCPGATFTGTSIEQASSLPFTLSGTTQVAISHAIWFFDERGARVDVRSQPGDVPGLVTCTYVYPGFPFLVYGSFQLTGPA